MSAAIDAYKAEIYRQRDLRYAFLSKLREEYQRICFEYDFAWTEIELQGGALYASDETWNKYTAISQVKRDFERNNL